MKKSNTGKEKWYFRTSTFVVALLCVGPLAIPLCWFNPRYRLRTKALLTVALLIITYYIGVWLRMLIKPIMESYR